METLQTWNIRTGTHVRVENEVWPEYDGPDFDGYYKCVRRAEDGKLVQVTATRAEYVAAHPNAR